MRDEAPWPFARRLAREGPSCLRRRAMRAGSRGGGLSIQEEARRGRDGGAPAEGLQPRLQAGGMVEDLVDAVAAAVVQLALGDDVVLAGKDVIAGGGELGAQRIDEEHAAA